MSDKAIKFSNGSSMETIRPSSDECVRGHRSEIPLHYDDWLVDEEMLYGAIKPFIVNKNVEDSYPYKQCRYRNYCGNCLAVGGFCTSVGEDNCRLKADFQGG